MCRDCVVILGSDKLHFKLGKTFQTAENER